MNWFRSILPHRHRSAVLSEQAEQAVTEKGASTSAALHGLLAMVDRLEASATQVAEMVVQDVSRGRR